MSEEILKALMQLFAIITKQDEGTSAIEQKYVEDFLLQQINEDDVKEYLKLYSEFSEIQTKKKSSPLTEDRKQKTGDGSEVGENALPSSVSRPPSPKRKLTSVKDSVRTLAICKKINKTLTQKQKVVVLVRLFELVNSDKQFTPQRLAIINTVAEVFNIDKKEFTDIENFVLQDDTSESVVERSRNDNSNIIIIGNEQPQCEHCRCIRSEQLDGNILILQVPSVELYFLRYTGKSVVYLNGLTVNERVYLFASGSTIRPPSRKPIYYSDIVSFFLTDKTSVKLSYTVNQIEYKFNNGHIGLRNVSLTEEAGKLIGIMGASGSGKTTLLNVFAGIEKPSKGEVLINGINLHKEKEKTKGIIGYIPQDDLLIEELSVFDNLYYNAKLCFKNLSEEEITTLVLKVLTNLGLHEIKNLKVGSPLNKKISGGQRKRLNIALELIREPSILFVDEPTSGLSSRDSENVMDLLRELALAGNLIFVVIHQPSSDIYKMFDNVIILDVGGYQIYYGNPVEAVMYFKRLDKQVNSNIGECPHCGNVNPELIFNTIEAKVIDEYGRFTTKRKVSAKQWRENFEKNLLAKNEQPTDSTAPLPNKLQIPSKIKQFIVYTLRDFFSKVSNTQYLLINLLETPLLAFILAFIIRYISKPNSSVYVFRENDNLPSYLFMSVIVVLFIGLTVSAEEIFRDRKILKREALLNLSRFSYLSSKLFILFSLSAIQALLFVIIGNSIVGIKGMYFDYWMMLFSVSCAANMLGLNISASFNSAVTIYIFIPLLVIPQMILGGAMFNFEKLNRYIGGGHRVPVVADFMVSRWAYEGLAVNQFKNNEYEKLFYDLEKVESEANFQIAYMLPELNSRVNKCQTIFVNKIALNFIRKKTDSSEIKKDFIMLRNELEKENLAVPDMKFKYLTQITPESFNQTIADSTKIYLNNLNDYYGGVFHVVNGQKDFLINKFEVNEEKRRLFEQIKNDYHNDHLTSVVKNTNTKYALVEKRNELVQRIDLVYLSPTKTNNPLDFRTHFYAPQKYFLGFTFDTFYFNIIAIWLLTALFFTTLYFEAFKQIGTLFHHTHKKK